MKLETTRIIDIWLDCREGLRAAVSKFYEIDFRDGLKQKFIYKDGKTYEITIKEIK